MDKQTRLKLTKLLIYMEKIRYSIISKQSLVTWVSNFISFFHKTLRNKFYLKYLSREK